MYANRQCNRLNTIAMRASYIFLILKRFPCENQEKAGWWSVSPRKNRDKFVLLGFWVDPLYWKSFIEIGEMACGATAWCSRGQTHNHAPCSLVCKLPTCVGCRSIDCSFASVKNKK